MVPLSTTHQTAAIELKTSGRTTAAEQIESAIRNLSIRPKPDFSGAVDRATNAMECVLQDITGEKQMTLGDYLREHSDLSRPFEKSIGRPMGLCLQFRRKTWQGERRAEAR
jgi:hypothetical protein